MLCCATCSALVHFGRLPRVCDLQLTVAEYTHAYGTFLTIFSVMFFGVIAFIRVADFIKGLILAVLAGIVIILGQFVWPAAILWRGVGIHVFSMPRQNFAPTGLQTTQAHCVCLHDCASHPPAHLQAPLPHENICSIV